MTVKELKAKLNEIDDNLNIAICVDTSKDVLHLRAKANPGEYGILIHKFSSKGHTIPRSFLPKS